MICMNVVGSLCKIKSANKNNFPMCANDQCSLVHMMNNEQSVIVNRNDLSLIKRG